VAAATVSFPAQHWMVDGTSHLPVVAALDAAIPSAPSGDTLDGTGGEPFSFPALVLLDAYKEVQTCRVPRRRAFLSAR